MRRLFLFILIGLLQAGSVYSAPSNLWPDDDARVDGSTDTMNDVDSFINTLSKDVRERVLSTDGETIAFQVNWTAAGRTAADLGTVTTADIDGGTIDGVTATFSNGLLMPSGAVFFMLTGSCPAGSTDVTATYSDRFLKVNATQGTTAGPILTATTGSTAADLAAHVHPITTTVDTSGANGAYLMRSSTPNSASTINTTSTGSGGGHAHPLSSATTSEPKSVTSKLCQVN